MVLGNHYSNGSKGSASEKKNSNDDVVNNNNNKNVEMGEDKISELADVLLLHILSFLPTKLVVSTSILSKRWKCLWKSLPVLDFREWPFHYNINTDTWYQKLLEEIKFMASVEKVLSSLDNGLKIQKFYLEYDQTIDKSRVSEWITTVIRRKVEEISLSIKAKIARFPPCFYTCESLRMLELRTYATLDLPESISFPRLKTLQLMNVKFVNEKATQQLFSNCHVLENLTLNKCHWEELNVVSISAPALKYLYIIGQGFANIGLSNCVLELNTPSLLSFSYLQGSAKDYILRSFSSLIDASIDLELCNPLKRKEIGHGAIKLLGGISNVKLLKLSSETFEALSFADGLLKNLPTFYNLIHLEVCSRIPPSGDRILLDFLQILPNLESLVFAEGFDSLPNDEDNWGLNLVPQFVLQYLKSVEIGAFDGKPRELKLVKLILENARVLERMTITFRKNKVEEVIDQLLMFPRGSTNCVVNFLSLLDIF